ncbi:hypothetical protein Sme01_11240 [Sphaerisporangium melleum]|uniref:Uncharacterized protein n=1 Tax=Sphaerisporangium melleum TaxID=321316 RepID=A0A917QS75_9ACTN|nr:hypothetical protein GCM10007964_06380 [Sphaerisporangium melleum]GII68648.1 hypothetical protein Sme01_11240 [Sphaerisporangium melleum]
MLSTTFPRRCGIPLDQRAGVRGTLARTGMAAPADSGAGEGRTSRRHVRHDQDITVAWMSWRERHDGATGRRDEANERRGTRGGTGERRAAAERARELGRTARAARTRCAMGAREDGAAV